MASPMMASRLKLESFIAALAGALALALLIQEIPRILFPWDFRMFSESTLLTNMMKLAAGQGPYTSVGDANSFIYAPGLDYVTFAVLRPFGAELDVRACRAVTVVIGLAAGAVAGRSSARLATLLGGSPGWALRTFSVCTAALVIFKSYTSDACHPDNLYILHATSLLALSCIVIATRSYRWALVAVAVASIAVLFKQTAALSLVGLTIILLLYCRSWGWRRLTALLVWAALWAVVAAFAFRGWGRVWAFDVPSHQAVEFFRAYRLVGNIMDTPSRLFLYVGVVPALLYVVIAGNDEARKWLVAWAAIGATEVLPAILSYFKVNGYWNNLTIIDVWLALPVVAAVWPMINATQAGERAGAGGALIVLVLSLTPIRATPTSGQYDFGRSLDAAIAADKAKGARVLLSVGAAPLVRNQLFEPPLDRASSTSELGAAHFVDFTDTKARLRARYYGAIYLLGWESPGYSPEIQSVIDENYRADRTIPGDGTQPLDSDRRGVMNMMHHGVTILVPRE